MTEKNILDEIMGKLTALVQTIQENAQPHNVAKAELPEDLQIKMQLLEFELSLFKQATEKALKETALSKEEMQESIQNPEKDLHGAQLKNFQRIQGLKKEVEHTGGQIETVLFSLKQKGELTKKGKAVDKNKERKKKFDKTGAKKGWKPL